MDNLKKNLNKIRKDGNTILMRLYLILFNNFLPLSPSNCIKNY